MGIEKWMKPATYADFADEVVQWNAVMCGDLHDLSDTKWEKQRQLVVEEHEELLVKGIKAEDRIEVIDAICDLFVVGSYWNFLEDGGSMNTTYRLCQHELPLVDMVSLQRAVGPKVHEAPKNTPRESYNPYVAFRNIMALVRGLDCNTRGALREVMDSNWSKFPTVQELSTKYVSCGLRVPETLDELISAESERILNSNDKGYVGITGKLIRSGDKAVLVFRDSNGKGMKPLTFREPQLGRF